MSVFMIRALLAPLFTNVPEELVVNVSDSPPAEVRFSEAVIEGE